MTYSLSKSAILAIFQDGLEWLCPVSVALKNSLQEFKNAFCYCPIHVVTFTLTSNLATDYIQKRRGEPCVFSFEYNLSPKLISK